MYKMGDFELFADYMYTEMCLIQLYLERDDGQYTLHGIGSIWEAKIGWFAIPITTLEVKPSVASKFVLDRLRRNYRESGSRRRRRV